MLCQATAELDSRVLWMMVMPVKILVRMKLRMKWIFHGPPDVSLHHFTALAKSGSIIRWRFLMKLQLNEIFIARCIAKISARLISIGGMGEENKHLKWPSSSLRTPPMADFCHFGWKVASTFHFRTHGEGSQMAQPNGGRVPT